MIPIDWRTLLYLHIYILYRFVPWNVKVLSLLYTKTPQVKTILLTKTTCSPHNNIRFTIKEKIEIVNCCSKVFIKLPWLLLLERLIRSPFVHVLVQYYFDVYLFYNIFYGLSYFIFRQNTKQTCVFSPLFQPSVFIF